MGKREGSTHAKAKQNPTADAPPAFIPDPGKEFRPRGEVLGGHRHDVAAGVVKVLRHEQRQLRGESKPEKDRRKQETETNETAAVVDVPVFAVCKALQRYHFLCVCP